MPKERRAKRLSGAKYRQQKDKKEKERKQSEGALLKYCNPGVSSCTQVSNEDSGNKCSAEQDSEFQEEECKKMIEQEQLSETDITTNAEKDYTKEEQLPEIDISIQISEDPGMWPTNLSNKTIQMLIENSPSQIKNIKYPVDDTGRSFSDLYYTRTLSNGEKVLRSWLLYSLSVNKVFCFPCKLFSYKENQLATIGLSDWQHLSQCLTRHEKSLIHINNCTKMMDLKKSLKSQTTIDHYELEIFNREKKYWSEVIKRIIYIIQFLARQNLALRGTSNKLFDAQNGNFLNAVEMLSKFDPIISEHVGRIQNKKESNKYMATYLGDKIQNEIISLISNEIKNKIVNSVTDAKYFSLILDCTPDVSHTEQITVIIRIVDLNKVTKKVDIKEYFIGFFPITNSTGEGLTDFILDKLDGLGLNIHNLRGQGYDNGANMRGRHNGLQQRILNINPRAFFIPCASHTLNLVVNDAAKINYETIDFFSTIQEIYIFFSSSTQRWDVLKRNVKNLVLKQVCDTRWESRINAVRPLRYELKEIFNSLLEITRDEKKDAKTKHQAKCLITKLESFKFICSIVIWYDILYNVNYVSKIMQNPKLNIKLCVDQLNNLLDYLKSKRSDTSFDDFVNESKHLANAIDTISNFPDISKTRPRKKRTQFLYEHPDEVIQNPEEKFKINFYFSIIDSTLNAIKDRFQLLNEHNNYFNFLYDIFNLNNISDKEILSSCMDLQLKLTDETKNERDMDAIDLADELKVLKNIVKENMNSVQILEYILENDLYEFFPNTVIVLRILLTMPVSVATGERSFSKLKIIKNYLRSTMSQDRLDNLATISIEHELSESLDMQEIIEKFSHLKARRFNEFM